MGHTRWTRVIGPSAFEVSRLPRAQQEKPAGTLVELEERGNQEVVYVAHIRDWTDPPRQARLTFTRALVVSGSFWVCGMAALCEGSPHLVEMQFLRDAQVHDFSELVEQILLTSRVERFFFEGMFVPLLAFVSLATRLNSVRVLSFGDCTVSRSALCDLFDALTENANTCQLEVLAFPRVCYRTSTMSIFQTMMTSVLREL